MAFFFSFNQELTLLWQQEFKVLIFFILLLLLTAIMFIQEKHSCKFHALKKSFIVQTSLTICNVIKQLMLKYRLTPSLHRSTKYTQRVQVLYPLMVIYHHFISRGSRGGELLQPHCRKGGNYESHHKPEN